MLWTFSDIGVQLVEKEDDVAEDEKEDEKREYAAGGNIADDDTAFNSVKVEGLNTQSSQSLNLEIPDFGHTENHQSSGRSTSQIKFGNADVDMSINRLTEEQSVQEINRPSINNNDDLNFGLQSSSVSKTDGGPIVEDDKASGNEDTVISGNVLKNDNDVDGTIAVENAGTFETDNGSITINEDGSYEYTPDENFNGSDSFEVTVVDDVGAKSTSTLELSVSDVNDGPVAEDDKASGVEDTVISGNVLKNDSDADGTITVENAGTFDTDNGSITVNENGSYEYTPNENYNGSDSFEVTIVDNDGTTSTSTLELTVNDVIMAGRRGHHAGIKE